MAAAQPGYGIGYGGTNYNQLDTAGKSALSANEQKAQNDAAYRAAELARAQTVIDNRTAQNLDTSAQNAYLAKLQGYQKVADASKPVIPTEQPTTPTTPTGNNSPITVTTPSQNTGQGNAQAYIDQLNEARKKAAIAGLGKSRDAALSNLGNEKLSIQPKYYDAKNQVAAGSQQQSRNFAEYMAARGGTSAGANAQAEISRNIGTQGGLNSLGRQETQAYTDIEHRTTDVNNAYASDVASAEAGIDADRVKDLLNDYYVAQQRGDTLAQNAIQNALAEAGVTGNYKNPNSGQSTQTIQAKQLAADNAYRDKTFDYGVGRDAVLDNRYNQQFDRSNFESDRSYELAKSGQEWGQLMQKQTFDFNKAQTIWENNFKDKSFLQSMNDAAAARGLQWASLTQRDKEFVADQEFKEKSYKADQDQRKLDNTYRDGLAANKPPAGGLNLDDYKGFINQNFYTDVLSNPLDTSSAKIKKFDPVGTRKYIFALHLPAEATKQMLDLYGLPLTTP